MMIKKFVAISAAILINIHYIINIMCIIEKDCVIIYNVIYIKLINNTFTLLNLHH